MRPWVNPNKGFLSQLRTWENEHLTSKRHWNLCSISQLIYWHNLLSPQPHFLKLFRINRWQFWGCYLTLGPDSHIPEGSLGGGRPALEGRGVKNATFWQISQILEISSNIGSKLSKPKIFPFIHQKVCEELQVVIDQPAGQPPEKGQREELMLPSLMFLTCLLPDWEWCCLTKLQITFARHSFQRGKFHSRRHSCQDRFHSRRDGVSQKGFCQRHWSSKFFLAGKSILSDGEQATQHKFSFILANQCVFRAPEVVYYSF